MRHLRLPLASLLVLAASLPGGPTPARNRIVSLVAHPDLEELEKLQEADYPVHIEGDTVRIELRGIHIQVRPLGEDERRAFYQVRSRLHADPFPTLEQFPEGFTFFEVSFLNATDHEFQFLPGMASILRGRMGSGSEELFVVSLGDLYSYFNRVFAGKQELITQALEVIYFKTLYLAPGERTSKLLVFEGLPKRTRRFVLKLDFLFLGSDVQDFAVPFVVEKVER